MVPPFHVVGRLGDVCLAGEVVPLLVLCLRLLLVVLPAVKAWSCTATAFRCCNSYCIHTFCLYACVWGVPSAWDPGLVMVRRGRGWLAIEAGTGQLSSTWIELDVHPPSMICSATYAKPSGIDKKIFFLVTSFLEAWDDPIAIHQV